MIRDLLWFVVLPTVLLAAAVLWMPMSVRDRYVLRKFSALFLLSFLLEVALILIVRFGDRELPSLFDEAQSLSEGLRLFLYKAPERVMEVIPASGILATFFTIGSLTRSNELTALKSLGANVYRLVLPIVVFTAICCAIALVFADRIMAPATHQARLLDRKTPYAADREIVFRESRGGLGYIQSLDLHRRRASNLVFYDFSEGQLQAETYASFATWGKGVWHLSHGWVRRGEGGKTTFERYSRKDRSLDADPRILVASANNPAEMTFAQLRRVIAFKERAGLPARAEIVRFHHNIAYSFALLVGVLLSLPLSMEFGRFAIVIGFPATMFISFLYWGMAIAIFEAMGENGRLSPALASWLANGIFAGIALVLFRGVRR